MPLTQSSLRTFLLRLVTLAAAIFIITFGCALCIRANLGSSPVSVFPYAWALGGGTTIGSFHVPQWTIGTYTFILNIFFVIIQIAVLRRRYQIVQLLQLAIASVFAVCIDINMYLTAPLQWTNLIACLVQLLIGGAIMAFGIALEVMARLIYKPGEGVIVAITQATHLSFGTVKILSDCTLVLLGTISMLLFFHTWHWYIVGIGTLISMFYVGAMVNLLRPITNTIDQHLFH